MSTNLVAEFKFDSLIPSEMAERAEKVGASKAKSDILTTFVLAVLAGAFISLGAIFSTTAVAGTTGMLPYGVIRVIAGFVFSLGLILVVVAGAELFTGNNLIVMAWANRQVSTGALLSNWALVYLGNFVGSIATAGLMIMTGQYQFGAGAIGLTALNIAKAKLEFTFIQAIALGVMCNALVCLAVWLCFSARSTTDKILAIIFPITAFVAAGFEHSVANMYFIPIGLLIKQYASPEFWTAIQKSAVDYANLTWQAFFINNLIPVTLGNIIGGAVMVGVVYWFIYLRSVRKG